MAHSDGQDIFFAGAGFLWGSITFLKGLQYWRRENRLLRASETASAEALPMHRADIPAIVLVGFALALSCSVYLLWSFFAP